MTMFRHTRSLGLMISRLLGATTARCRLSSRTIFTSTLTHKRCAKKEEDRREPNQTNIIRSPAADYDIPESPFLPHYIMEHWHKFPNKIALINGETGDKMSYGELQTKIIKLGSALTKLGFGKGDIMTITSPNCPEYCIVFMAATAIGMTVSAVNPQYTAGELEHALNYSESKVLVFSPLLTEVVSTCLPNCHTIKRTIVLGSVSGHLPLADLLQDDGKAFPENVPHNSKDDVVSLPYSSGTSGPPKGVMLTSYSTVANLVQIGNPDMLSTEHDQVFLCILPLFHIFAQCVIMYLGFRFGNTIITMAKFDPVAYLENVNKYKPTHLHIVPPIMMFLASHPMVPKYDFASVQECFYSAAPTAVSVINQFQERFGDKIRLCQGYGMTELSPGSHLNPRRRTKPETVGVVVPNAQFKILDIETGQPLPAFKEGELCVKGPQMMKGYFKNEKATRETIIDGWLHTGDIAYYDEDGYTVITDRMKELIKVKGFQVAPAELEGLLLTHPAVQDVAVIGKPDDMAGELPRAYIVLKLGAKTTEEEIANFVKEKAAPYKQLKGGVEFRKEIPKSASGKTLRRILRDELRQTLSHK